PLSTPPPPARPPGVLREPHAEHFRDRQAREIPDDFGDHGARLGAPEVEASHEPPLPRHAPPLPRSARRTTTWPANRASSSAYSRPVAAKSCPTSATARITSGPASRRRSTRCSP